MKKWSSLMFVILMLLQMTSYAQQEVQHVYYKDLNAQKEVPKDKAKYEKITTYENQSKKLIEYRKTKKSNQLWFEEYRKDKASGDWHLWRSSSKNKPYKDLLYGEYSPEGFYDLDTKKNLLVADSIADCVLPKLKIDNIKNFAMYEWWTLNSGLAKQIATTMNYPLEALKRQIAGDVYLQFCIDEKGEVGFIRIVNGVSKLLDAEAYRVVSSLPNFTPTYLNGEAVGMRIVKVPISFKITNKVNKEGKYLMP